MSEMHELNDDKALAYLVNRITAHLRATYEWVPSMAGEVARMNSASNAGTPPPPEEPGWKVTPVFGAFPDTDLSDKGSSEEINYRGGLVGLFPSLCDAHTFVDEIFEHSWVAHRTHEINGSEKAFQKTLDFEISEGTTKLHELLVIEPRFLEDPLDAS
jgi:hypothetical protein